MVTRSHAMLVAIPSKDPASVQLAPQDSMPVRIRHIVNCVSLDTTVVEEFNQSVIQEPFPLQVLDIVLLAVVDTFVMVINE